MASAYTPGLTVSADTVIRRTRRLPIKGDVIVAKGEAVLADQPVARALLPGALQTIRMAEKLGVQPSDLKSVFKLEVGTLVEKGQVLVETKAFFGLMKTRVESDYTGTIESISDVTGSVLVREPPTPVEIKAYIKGEIAEIMPGEGVVVETRCAMVQGIFGVGGERHGSIRVAVGDPSEVLHAGHIADDDRSRILIGGAGMTYDAIEQAAKVGAAGLVAGGLRDSDLIKFLGYDIGVAITGQEAVDVTLLVTEGFGDLAMAHRTFELLKSLEGQEASINGATQIRAGVIRPEIIVPHAGAAPVQRASPDAFELRVGASIRAIREPFFGLLGTVSELPPEPVTLESGTRVRVLRAKLADGREVTIPRANVEIVAA